MELLRNSKVCAHVEAQMTHVDPCLQDKKARKLTKKRVCLCLRVCLPVVRCSADAFSRCSSGLCFVRSASLRSWALSSRRAGGPTRLVVWCIPYPVMVIMLSVWALGVCVIGKCSVMTMYHKAFDMRLYASLLCNLQLRTITRSFYCKEVILMCCRESSYIS